MTRVSGKDFEDVVVARWKAFGKRGYIYRLEDASDLHGLNDRVINTTPKPADFVAVFEGWMGYVEAKDCTNTIGFPMSNIKRNQFQAAVLTTAAQGNYRFVIRNKTDSRVYFVPASFLLNHKGRVPWAVLEPWYWKDSQCPPLFPTRCAALTSRQPAPIQATPP